MRSVLFYFPEQLFGLPFLGWGLFLAAWLIVCVVVLVVSIRRQGWNAETQGYLPIMALIAAVIVFVMPRLGEPGVGLPIRGYGVMMLAGIVGGVGLSLRRARERGIDPEHIYSLAFWMVACGIVGARAYFVAKEWSSFQRHTLVETLVAIINIPEGGLVVYGSLFGAIGAFVYYTWRHQLSMLSVADIVAPSMMVGLALGRIGCFLNGCCFGSECDLPWAVRFPWQSPPHVQHVRQGLVYLHGIKIAADDQGKPIVGDVQADSLAAAQGLKAGQKVLMVQGLPAVTARFAEDALFSVAPTDSQVTIVTEGDTQPRTWTLSLASERSRPIHPAQLYATFGALLVVVVLLGWEPYRRTDGEVFAMFLVVYPTLRFVEEMLRRDEPTYGGLKIAQWISVGLIVAGSVLWIKLRRGVGDGEVREHG
jgi:phosphatidylglycerol:prolipoprotein diacylglycerol transferase